MICCNLFSQKHSLQLNVGEKYLTGEYTFLYSNQDGSGAVITPVPRRSIVKILDKGKYNNHFVEYKGYKGYIIDFAFGENPVLMEVESRIKTYVENEINLWQKKGEFEKTTDFQKRVNEQSRYIKVQELTNIAINKLKAEYLTRITTKSFVLGEYDADNETFLIKTDEFGNFPLKVPIDNAKSFKSNWSSMEFKNVDFYIKDNQFYIAKLDITSPYENTTFSYDSKIPTSYSVNNFKYNFAPIEIDIKNQENINYKIVQRDTVIIGKPDINIDIPLNSHQNKNYFAVIIGNENYKNEIKVNYAIYDAKSVSEYFSRTLGIPEINIHYIGDATYGQMLSEIEWLNNVSNAFNGNVRLFFYYAGHGIPNEQTRSAYLLPIDGNSSITQTAIKVEYLYDKLAISHPELATVFIDACFSGAARDGILAEGRGIKIQPKEDILKGNLVVFSAASGDETAYPYLEKQHGLFTYFLLKKIKESKGDVSYAELSEFINTNVNQQSIILNQKNQTPRTNISSELTQDWKRLKLR
jgi:hypothetical protein